MFLGKKLKSKKKNLRTTKFIKITIEVYFQYSFQQPVPVIVIRELKYSWLLNAWFQNSYSSPISYCLFFLKILKCWGITKILFLEMFLIIIKFYE